MKEHSAFTVFVDYCRPHGGQRTMETTRLRLRASEIFYPSRPIIMTYHFDKARFNCLKNILNANNSNE